MSAIDRTQRLQELSWFIEQAPPGTLVLGDVGPVGRSDEANEIGSLLRRNGEALTGVYLPVSSEYLLIGHPQGTSATIEIETLNIATVEPSRDFFVESQNTERERAYLRRVGRRSDLIDAEEISASTLKWFAEI